MEQVSEYMEEEKSRNDSFERASSKHSFSPAMYSPPPGHKMKTQTVQNQLIHTITNEKDKGLNEIDTLIELNVRKPKVEVSDCFLSKYNVGGRN